MRARAVAYMVAPAIHGDPVTALDYVEHAQQLVTGSVYGAVRVWHVGHLLAQHGRARGAAPIPEGFRRKEAGREREEDEDEGGPQFLCHELCAASDEGIRGVYVDPTTDAVFAAVGDISVKTWESVRTRAFKLIKLQRASMFGAPGVTLVSGRFMLVVQPQSSDAVVLDMLAERQRTLRFFLPGDANAMHFDGQRLVVLEIVDKTRREVKVYDLERNLLVGKLPLSDLDKVYWGFQTSGDRMAHVSSRNVIKVHSLASLVGFREYATNASVAHSVAGDRPVSALGAEAAPRPGARTYTHRFSTHKGRVLALLFHRNGQEIVSLASDRKVKVWSLAANRCVRTYYGVPGRFDMGLPRILRLVGALLFYTADDGVYCLELDAPPAAAAAAAAAAPKRRA
jgi:WD40 repeat protein